MKNKTLKSIFLLCLVSCILCLNVNAQIVYTDVIPDQTFNTNGSVYHLDLDNNGVTDFEITIFTLSGSFPRAIISLTSSSGNAVATTNTFAAAYSYGTSITSTNTWAGATIVMAGDGWAMNQHTGQLLHSTYGNWVNKTDYYLGLKFISNGNTYFGWTRLDSHVYSNGTANFTIKGFAYNSIANQSILAGQTCSPQAAIKANGPLSFCTGGSVTLTSKNSGNTLTYQWKKNNINISGATNKNNTVTIAER